MTPETGTALLVLVAFILPGFVAVLVAERTYEVPVRQRSPFELLLLTGYYSVVSYAIVGLASWPFGLTRNTLRRWYHQESLGRLAALGFVAIIVVPALVATIGRLWTKGPMRLRILRRLGVHDTHRVSTGWDEFFRWGRPALVRLVLSDQRVVAGFYGSKSFSGYAEQNADLLLEQAWVLDDENWFKLPAPESIGLWVPGSAIVSMELYDVSDDETDAAVESESASAEGIRASATSTGEGAV